MKNKDNRSLYGIIIILAILLVLYFVFLKDNGQKSGNGQINQSQIDEMTAPSKSDGLNDAERQKIIEETTAPQANAMGTFSEILNVETSAPSN